MKKRITLEVEVEPNDDPTKWDWPELLDLDDRDRVRIVADPDPFAQAWWVVAATFKGEGLTDFDEYVLFEPSDGRLAVEAYLQHLQRDDLVTACLCRVVLSTDHEGAGQAYIDDTVPDLSRIEARVIAQQGENFSPATPYKDGDRVQTAEGVAVIGTPTGREPLKLSGTMREVPFDDAPRTTVKRVRKDPDNPERPGGEGGSLDMDPHIVWTLRELLKGKTMQRRVFDGAWKWQDIEAGPEGMCYVIAAPQAQTYRVKPKPVERWMGIFDNGDIGPARATQEYAKQACYGNVSKFMRVRIDPDTLELIETSVEDV